MTQTSASTRPAADAARRAAFRPIVGFVIAFVAVSAAMIAFLVGIAATGTGVDTAIWIRCSLVLASAVLLLVFAVGAARGSRSAWVRLRIVSPIVVVAVIVIVSIPGFLPDWVRVEQAVCGLLVLPVAVMTNLPRIGGHFPREA
ncbi:MAG: hypothetical protein BGO15_00025 [Microbacterium sp. 71-23]|uniref:hypothetical protein n=1 Tax=unclassified Microbacterium TaxID=2609290 RepID=UPI000929524E|nr:MULTISPECIES: hypothetical protein [unclassified Microbacterium]MBN9183981.1 hypothetical protein [Microbacterium sp.]MBN9193513.1 hypothetical protein [Microbacterium sp.]OJU74127.1 MAG: hypothetical protein BGO15_00025 [Microbacterium sp. 71-23]